MARKKAGDEQQPEQSLSDSGMPENTAPVQADDNSIAVGGIQIGGDVSGSITIGHGYTAEQVSLLLTQITSNYQRKPFDGRCPYKGLEVFEEEDAELFFGRERLVAELVDRVRGSRTVFITGPSGSGKSSLVRAGLLHALKQGAIQDLHSERWLYETMKPGREPLKDLALAFSRLKGPDLADYFLAHAGEKEVLQKCADSVLSGQKDQRFVLFIDQFEEVFTQVNQEAERLAFLNLLAHAGTAGNGRVIVLFAMRSDFVSNCAVYPMLNELLSHQFRQIGAMQPDELVSAIALPALHVGLPVEDELIARIINDMKGEPGALPLMQFALKDLFDSQQAKGRLVALTLKDYVQHGGIHKSLERHADRTFARLGEGEQELARSIFGGLIEIGRGTSDTRRTALFDELVPANTRPEEVLAVVQKLADARLVITDEQADQDTVTISHEKLIDAWPWLKKLVNENRDAIALQNEIAVDAKEWQDHRRDPSYLYTGARLTNVQEQLRARKLLLSGQSQEFVRAGERQQQRSRVIRWMGITVPVGLLIAAVLVISYLSSANSAERAAQNASFAQTQGAAASTSQAIAAQALESAEEARKQATISRSQALAAQSQLQRSTKSQLSLLLALEAFDLVAGLPHKDRLLPEQNLRDSLSQMGGIPLLGHETMITAIAFSHDGTWMATASIEGTVRLWNPDDPSAEPMILSGYAYSPRMLAFSPDSRWLATGSLDPLTRLPDNKVLLWDLTGRSTEPVVLQGHEDKVFNLAFSPDGHWLATGSWDSTVRLWNIDDLEAEPVVLRGHESAIISLAFSPDGQWLATGANDATARLWDMDRLSADPIVLPGHKHPVLHLAFSPDGRWLVTGETFEAGEGANVRAWDMTDLSREPPVLQGDGAQITILTFSPDGYWLVVGRQRSSGNGSAVRLFQIPNVYPAFAGSGNLIDLDLDVSTVAFSPDSRSLAMGSQATSAFLLSPYNTSGDPLPLRGHQNAVSALAFSPDGRWLATGSGDTTVRLWDMTNLFVEPVVVPYSHYGVFAESPDGHWGASADTEHVVSVYNMRNPDENPLTLRGHKDAVLALRFSPDSQWLATASTDRTVRLWDMSKPQPDAIILRGTVFAQDALAFSEDGRWLAAGSYGPAIYLWNREDFSAPPVVLRDLEDTVTIMTFSPDGDWLFAGSFGGPYRLWNTADPSKEPILLPGAESGIEIIEIAEFSEDGRWLVTGGRDGTSRVWDMHDLSAAPIILRGHEGRVLAVALSRDKQWLATGGEDSTVRLWDLTTLSSEPIILRGHSALIFDLIFSKDSHWLESRSEDGTARLWNLDMQEMVSTACKVIGRNFTRAEWAQYFVDREYTKTCEQWPLEPEPAEIPSPAQP